MPKRAASSHPEMANTVNAETTGWVVSMSMQNIVPSDVPTAKLLSRIVKLWTAKIAMIVLGLAPIARRTANSWCCSSMVSI